MIAPDTTNPYPFELWAVIPAAGYGARVQSDVPKQYLFINGITIMETVISGLLEIPGLKGCMIALAHDDQRFHELAVSRDSRVHTVIGGDSRAVSVSNALKAVQDKAADDAWVLVHDAARPLVAKTDIKRLTDAVFNSGRDGGLLAIPVSDTLKLADTDYTVSRTVDRNGLWQAQTPQLFPVATLAGALDKAMAQKDFDVTDEASAMENAGHDPLLVEALEPNIKVTRYSDLVIANVFVTAQRMNDAVVKTPSYHE